MDFDLSEKKSITALTRPSSKDPVRLSTFINVLVCMKRTHNLVSSLLIRNAMVVVRECLLLGERRKKESLMNYTRSS